MTYSNLNMSFQCIIQKIKIIIVVGKKISTAKTDIHMAYDNQNIYLQNKTVR
jgi:hypothetical protein